jgi:hypothetical protein
MCSSPARKQLRESMCSSPARKQISLRKQHRTLTNPPATSHGPDRPAFTPSVVMVHQAATSDPQARPIYPKDILVRRPDASRRYSMDTFFSFFISDNQKQMHTPSVHKKMFQIWTNLDV